MAGRAEAVGLDVGGTKIAALRVMQTGEVVARAEIPTPEGDSVEIVGAMERAFSEVRSPASAAVGVGVAGMVEFEAGVLRYSPNLPFRDEPLRKEVEDFSGLDAVIENDASAAAWGEYRLGAGRGSKVMLLVTVGTGIGGGIVAGDALYRGAHGFASEIGHFVVEPNGPRCGCGNAGCWEQMASGRALDRLGREAATSAPGSALARLAGGETSKVTGRTVTRAAEEGDPVAMEVLREVGRRLGQGMAGLANIIDPDLVVVGGGVAEIGERLLAPAREVFASSVMAPRYRPSIPVVPAKLGNDAGAMGAALLALESLAR